MQAEWHYGRSHQHRPPYRQHEPERDNEHARCRQANKQQEDHPEQPVEGWLNELPQ